MNNAFVNPEAPFGESHGPMVTGVFAPVFEEYVLDDLPVEGEIPADLNGVYLRNGPNPRFEPNGNYHAFDGDGMPVARSRTATRGYAPPPGKRKTGPA